MRCLVPFVQFKKREKHSWRNFSLPCNIPSLGIFTFFVQIVQNLAAHLICDNLFHSFLNTKTWILFELLCWLSNPIDSIHTNLNQINFFSVHAVFSWYKVTCANIVHFLDWKCLIIETISVKKEVPVCRNLFVTAITQEKRSYVSLLRLSC